MVDESMTVSTATPANIAGSVWIKPGTSPVKVFEPIPLAEYDDLINDPSTAYANYFPTSPDGEYSSYCT